MSAKHCIWLIPTLFLELCVSSSLCVKSNGIFLLQMWKTTSIRLHSFQWACFSCHLGRRKGRRCVKEPGLKCKSFFILTFPLHVVAHAIVFVDSLTCLSQKVHGLLIALVDSNPALFKLLRYSLIRKQRPWVRRMSYKSMFAVATWHLSPISVFLQNCVLSFHRHGMQGKSLQTKQVTAEVADGSKVFHLLGSHG